MPLEYFDASQVIVWYPGDKELYESSSIWRPIRSYIFILTDDRIGNENLIFVIGLNGFG